MNKVILMGRLTADPEVRYSQGEEPTCIANYTLAVPRKFSKERENQQTDFIRCVAFGKNGEFAEKYLRKAVKITITGRIQTGSYTSKEGQRVYTTDIVVEEQEFVESKAVNDKYINGQTQNSNTANNPANDGFIGLGDGINEDLPFN